MLILVTVLQKTIKSVKLNTPSLIIIYQHKLIYIQIRMSSTKQDLPSARQQKPNIKKRFKTENMGTKMVQSGINTQIIYRNINSHAKGAMSRGKRSESSSFSSKINTIRPQTDILKNAQRQKSFTLQNEKQVNKIANSKKLLPIQPPSTKNQFLQNQASTVTIDLQDKDQILQKLRDRNKMLKDQIYRIQKLQQQKQSQSLQKKQYSFDDIYYATSTKESLMQELSNAYFKIKQMEAEIQELRKIEALDQPKKMAKLKARIIEVEKIKNERILKLDKMKRENKKVQEKIDECRQGGGYAQTIKQLIIQTDQLRQRHSQYSAYEDKRKEKILKQQQYIRKLQKELAQNGVSSQFIQELMNKVVYGIDKGKNKIPQKIDILPVLKKPSRQQMIKQYQKAKYEIGVLTKSVKQQQKTFQEATAQQKISNLRYEKAQLQSQQLDQEIQQLEKQILQTRKLINPTNLKPKPLPPKEPSLEEQKNQQKEHMREMRKKFHERKTKKYLQGLENLDQPNEFNEPKEESKLEIKLDNEGQIQNVEKNEQVSERLQREQENKDEGDLWEKETDVEVFGNSRAQGVKFSDKQICEKIGLDDCKITGFSVLLEASNSILGLRAQYNHSEKSQYHKTPRQSPSELQQQFSCVDEQYITSISGTFSQNNILLNLTVLTSLNRYHRFGSVSTTKSQAKGYKQFDICSDGNYRPLYILGCANESGICQFGAKVFKEESSSESQSQGDDD